MINKLLFFKNLYYLLFIHGDWGLGIGELGGVIVIEVQSANGYA